MNDQLTTGSARHAVDEATEERVVVERERDFGLARQGSIGVERPVAAIIGLEATRATLAIVVWELLLADGANEPMPALVPPSVVPGKPCPRSVGTRPSPTSL